MNRIEISISSLVKAIIIMIIGLLLIMQVPTYATTGKSTGDVVNVREKPSTDTNVKIVEQLGLNDVVEILGEEGDWYKINFQGTIGYASKSFISTNNSNTQTSNEPKNEETNNNVNNQTNNQENQTENVDNTEKADDSANVAVNEKENEANTETTTVTRVYKMADNSKVRILPIITAEEIGEAKKGESVSLVINAGLWVYVDSENVSGWIRIDKLSTENVIASDNTEKTDEGANSTQKDEAKQDNAAETVKIESKKMYVRSNAVNVRSDSNTSSDIIDSVELNTEVTAIGEKNGWYQVQVNGATGYIRKDLLSNDKTEVTSRNNQLDRTTAQNTAQGNANSSSQQSTTAVVVETSTESVPVSASGVSGSDIAAYAQQFVGCSYVYGAAGPNTFDCSGLTSYVYKHFGYTLHRTSKDQANDGVAVTGELQPGDILVFSNDGKQVGHVGIYIGNDKFVHASDSSTGVIISNLHDRWNINKYWGARRIIQ